MTTTTLTLQPGRDDIHFGARVGGVTRDNVTDASLRAQLNDAFEEYGLLVFEGVEPTPAMHVAISNVFGALKDHPSQAVHRAGGDDMLGVIEMRHEPNAPGRVEFGGRQLS